MAAKAWRQRAIYAAMSAILAWHSFVILVAPLPEASAVAKALWPVVNPYVSLLMLDNHWDFFAPNVAAGYELRYILDTADGTSRIFVPMKEISWYHPYHIWTDQWQDAIVDRPETYADLAAALVCREQASWRPTAVTVVEVEQKPFGPEDYLAGARPLDPDFVAENVLKRVPCPAQ
jgi:hypothetical protein